MGVQMVVGSAIAVLAGIVRGEPRGLHNTNNNGTSFEPSFLVSAGILNPGYVLVLRSEYRGFHAGEGLTTLTRAY